MLPYEPTATTHEYDSYSSKQCRTNNNTNRYRNNRRRYHNNNHRRFRHQTTKRQPYHPQQHQETQTIIILSEAMCVWNVPPAAAPALNASDGPQLVIKLEKGRKIKLLHTSPTNGYHYVISPVEGWANINKLQLADVDDVKTQKSIHVESDMSDSSTPSVCIELPKPASVGLLNNYQNQDIEMSANDEKTNRNTNRSRSRSRSRSRDGDGAKNIDIHRNRNRIKRDFKFNINNNDNNNKFIDTQRPFKHKCLLHPKQLQQLPLSGIWISKHNHDKKYVFYEDCDGALIGYLDEPHICGISGRVVRPKKCSLLQTMVQFEQRWTMYSEHTHDINTVCSGIIDDFGDEMQLEYASFSQSQHIFKNRGRNTLCRLARSSESGCLTGNWRLFQYNPHTNDINQTIYTNVIAQTQQNVFTLFDDFELDLDPDDKNKNKNQNKKEDDNDKEIMFAPLDSYESMIEIHSQLNQFEKEKRDLKDRKYRNNDKYKHCIQLTHFLDDGLYGILNKNKSLCLIVGKVYRSDNKFVFIQHWKSSNKACGNFTNLYPCITRVVGHYDASCTRICAHYQLLYPLGNGHGDGNGNKHTKKSEYAAMLTLNKIICNITNSSNYRLEMENETDKILIIADEKYLILNEGKCLYFRDFSPHNDLFVPFYDEFYDRSKEIYSHSRHFAANFLEDGSGREGICMMQSKKGVTHYAAYHPSHNILVLGEADFSFTLGLLRLRGVGKGKGKIIGTSYLCRRGPTKSVYGPQPSYYVSDPMFRQFLDEGENGQLFNILHEIWRRKGRTFHGIDARRIEETLRPQLGSEPQSFDRIIFPFPRASLKKYDCDLDNDLIGGLFSCSIRQLSPIGELHIIFHTNRDGISQFDIWKIRDLSESLGMIWRGAFPFNWRSLPPYHPKDVKNQQWKPYIATLHIFTPKISGWSPKYRWWRPKNEKWSDLSSKFINIGKRDKVGTKQPFIPKCNDIAIDQDIEMKEIIMPKPNVVLNANIAQIIQKEFVDKLIINAINTSEL